jgi:hypothetical protein
MASLLDRPSVAAATIAAAASIGIALASLIGGSISASFQQESDTEKLKTTVVIDIVNWPEAQRGSFAAQLIQSGVLPDKDGSICMAFVHKGCPLEILKPN